MKKIEHPNFIENGKVFLVKCPECNLENYAFNVAIGVCAWCGYDANAENKSEEVKNETQRTN